MRKVQKPNFEPRLTKLLFHEYPSDSMHIHRRLRNGSGTESLKKMNTTFRSVTLVWNAEQHKTNFFFDFQTPEKNIYFQNFEKPKNTSNDLVVSLPEKFFLTWIRCTQRPWRFSQNDKIQIFKCPQRILESKNWKSYFTSDGLRDFTPENFYPVPIGRFWPKRHYGQNRENLDFSRFQDFPNFEKSLLRKG